MSVLNRREFLAGAGAVASSCVLGRGVGDFEGKLFNISTDNRFKPILEWDFKDGWDGEKFTDLSGNGNDGVLYRQSGSIDYEVGSDYILPYGYTAIRQSQTYDFASNATKDLSEIVVLDYEYISPVNEIYFFGVCCDYGVLYGGTFTRNPYYNDNLISAGEIGNFTVGKGIKNIGRVVIALRFKDGIHATGWINNVKRDEEASVGYDGTYKLLGSWPLTRFAMNKIGSKDAAHVKYSHAEVYNVAVSDSFVQERTNILAQKYGISL